MEVRTSCEKSELMWMEHMEKVLNYKNPSKTIQA